MSATSSVTPPIFVVNSDRRQGDEVDYLAATLLMAREDECEEYARAAYEENIRLWGCTLPWEKVHHIFRQAFGLAPRPEVSND